MNTLPLPTDRRPTPEVDLSEAAVHPFDLWDVPKRRGLVIFYLAALAFGFIAWAVAIWWTLKDTGVPL